MIKILIVSDTHNDISSLDQALQAESDATHIFHAGDYAKDIRAIDISHKETYAVRGNCDGKYALEKDTQVVTIGKTRFMLTHGHKYGVKTGLDQIILEGKKRNIDAIIFGHTHKAICENIEGILLVNPGSLSSARSQIRTYATIALNDDGELTHIKLKQLGNIPN